MTGDFEKIREILKISRPPSELNILDMVSKIDWIAQSNEEIEIICDILIRISSDVIVISHEKDGLIKDLYIDTFNKIARKVEASGVIEKSQEIKEYFVKYLDYMSDL